MMERKRLTSPNHKMLGFHAYVGPQNPYSMPMILGELCLSNVDTLPGYSARKILDEVFARLAEYEDGEAENARLRATLFCEECGGQGGSCWCNDGGEWDPCPTCDPLREQLRRDE